MAARKTAEKTADKVQPKFSKEQIVGAERFRNNRDLVEALLDDKKKYTMEEVDKLVSDYMKGKVK